MSELVTTNNLNFHLQLVVLMSHQKTSLEEYRLLLPWPYFSSLAQADIHQAIYIRMFSFFSPKINFIILHKYWIYYALFMCKIQFFVHFLFVLLNFYEFNNFFHLHRNGFIWMTATISNINIWTLKVFCSFDVVKNLISRF